MGGQARKEHIPFAALILTLTCSPDDSKSSSPEPVTHLKWDDPYYDIARHQIVEVAGEHHPSPPPHHTSSLQVYFWLWVGWEGYDPGPGLQPSKAWTLNPWFWT